MTIVCCSYCGRHIELVDDGHGAVLMGHRSSVVPAGRWCAGGGRKS